METGLEFDLVTRKTSPILDAYKHSAESPRTRKSSKYSEYGILNMSAILLRPSRHRSRRTSSNPSLGTPLVHGKISFRIETSPFVNARFRSEGLAFDFIDLLFITHWSIQLASHGLLLIYDGTYLRHGKSANGF